MAPTGFHQIELLISIFEVTFAFTTHSFHFHDDARSKVRRKHRTTNQIHQIELDRNEIEVSSSK